MMMRSVLIRWFIGQRCCFFSDEILNWQPANALEQKDSRNIVRTICSYSISLHVRNSHFQIRQSCFLYAGRYFERRLADFLYVNLENFFHVMLSHKKAIFSFKDYRWTKYEIFTSGFWTDFANFSDEAATQKTSCVVEYFFNFVYKKLEIIKLSGVLSRRQYSLSCSFLYVCFSYAGTYCILAALFWISWRELSLVSLQQPKPSSNN